MRIDDNQTGRANPGIIAFNIGDSDIDSLNTLLQQSSVLTAAAKLKFKSAGKCLEKIRKAEKLYTGLMTFEKKVLKGELDSMPQYTTHPGSRKKREMSQSLELFQCDVKKLKDKESRLHYAEQKYIGLTTALRDIKEDHAAGTKQTWMIIKQRTVLVKDLNAQKEKQMILNNNLEELLAKLEEDPGGQALLEKTAIIEKVIKTLYTNIHIRVKELSSLDVDLVQKKEDLFQKENKLKIMKKNISDIENTILSLKEEMNLEFKDLTQGLDIAINNIKGVLQELVKFLKEDIHEIKSKIKGQSDFNQKAYYLVQDHQKKIEK